jgi:hypothetical protein
VRDVIPEVVLERIGTQYERAVTRALSNFQYSREKEDAVTAALGATMSEVVRGRRQIDGQMYSWTTNTWTLGSHYKGPESEYGADALIDFELRDENDIVVAHKLLPVQAKKGRPYDRRILLDQAKRIAKLPGGGVIVSFAENEYTCCNAEVVANAEGHWDEVPSTKKRRLGEVLRKDFLVCKVGSRDLSYNSRRKVVVVHENGSSREIRFRVRRRTRTIVRVRGRNA